MADANFQAATFLTSKPDPDLESLLQDGLRNCIGVAAPNPVPGQNPDQPLVAEPVNRRLTTSSEGVFGTRQSSVLSTGAMDLGTVSAKNQAKTRKLLQRFFESEFPQNEKLFAADTEPEITNLLRHIAALSPKELAWRKDRGYLMSENFELVSSEQSDPQITLAISGHLRGCGISTKNVVHLTGVGDFEVLRVARWKESGGAASICKTVDAELATVEKDKFARLRPYDPLMNGGEQTWPSRQEMDAAAEDDIMMSGQMAIPDAATGAIPMELLKNTIASPNVGERLLPLDGGAAEGRNDDASMGGDEKNEDDGRSSVGSFDDLNEELFKNAEEHVKSKHQVTFEDRAREDMDFPDEVDTPVGEGQSARERFQRYRGLRSFKNSHWDPYLELPLEYGRIFEFDSFNAATHAFKKAHRDNAVSELEQDASELEEYSSYITITVKCADLDGAVRKKLEKEGVLTGDVTGVLRRAPLIVSSLFDCERKVSVIHVNVSRVESSAVAEHLELLHSSIKSKTPLEFQCGFRKFVAAPIFSTVPKKGSGCTNGGAGGASGNIGEKHLYHRYLHPSCCATASFYAPIVVTPCPVLLFGRVLDRNDQNIISGMNSGRASVMSTSSSFPGEPSSPSDQLLLSPSAGTASTIKPLLATGSVLGADPRKLIIKRAIVAGYPYRVHKNKAVVRHMFFSPEDINWFKPVELQTKFGLRGNIKESLGTHGYMKCIFGDRMKQNDTVGLYLYKRQYPKWFPNTWGSRTAADDEDCDGEI